ncbi:ATP-binding protein [Thermoactinospora rubra]|uniref:ATP-binding protein n=1 Tax=Thermoactinospora rubra TaxID=1088767 RepID=UPI000A11AB5D|nr:ATPase [Thermoactinospora rubra]
MRKPDRILDRDDDWAELSRFLAFPDPQLRLALVSGRRRVGKSFLLRALAEEGDGLYVTAVAEEGVVTARERLATDIARYAGISPHLLGGGDWESLLATAIQLTARRSGVLVLDEFPYWLTHSPELPGLLQLLYDRSRAGQGPGGRLIICGSAMSVMHNLLSGTKALRGRATLDLRLPPFDLATMAAHWQIADPQTALRVHAILGGAPGYRDLANVPPPQSLPELDAWVPATVLNPRQALYSAHEAEYLLREDPKFTGSALHYGIVNAVARGATSPSKIGALLEQDRTMLARPVEALRSAGYLRYEKDPLWERRPVITLADPIVRFHNLITIPMLNLVETGRSVQAWQRSQATFLSRILGPHFEECCREWVRNAEPYGAAEQVTATVVNDGKGQARHEIDVVALDRHAGRATVHLIGEAKATVTPRGVADLDRLEHLRDLLARQGHETGSSVLALFSTEGFHRDLIDTARRRGGVLLVDLPTLFGLREPPVAP